MHYWSFLADNCSLSAFHILIFRAVIILHLVVDGIILIMALLAWEEMRLSTLNKIFIRRMHFTMAKYGMVKRGHYCVTWSLFSDLSDKSHLEHFDNWEDAYHAFRFHVFLGHEYVALSYSLFCCGGDEFLDIVCFLNWHGTPAYKWYSGSWSDLEGRAV